MCVGDIVLVFVLLFYFLYCISLFISLFIHLYQQMMVVCFLPRLHQDSVNSRRADAAAVMLTVAFPGPSMKLLAKV
jgi:hypothetical protein